MNYLIKIIIILLAISSNFTANGESLEKIIFKLNNKVFTTTELDNINKYYKLIYNDLNYKNKNLLQNYISLIIFNEFFILNKKNNNEDIDKIYKNLFSKFESQESSFNLIFNDIGKDNIYKYLTYELNKKKIIEELINSKENISLTNIDKENLIYNIFFKYFIINKEDYSIIKNKIEEIKIDESKFKSLLDENNVNFLYKEEILNNANNLEKNIKKIIETQNRNFITYDDNYITYGFIEKKLKTYDGIKVKLFNIESKINIKKSDINCKNIVNLKNNNSLNIISSEYKYNLLKETIKNNLNLVNDFIKLESDNKINYILLCEIQFNEKLFNEIYINENVNNFVKEIENEFINKYKKKYNLIIFDE